MNEYINYLKRLGRTGNKSLWELHQLALSREVARWYGMTEDEILRLDAELKQEGDAPK